MIDRKYAMLHLCDIYDAERRAMRGVVALAAVGSGEDCNAATFDALQRQIGIRLMMDEIEALVDAKEKESGGGE